MKTIISLAFAQDNNNFEEEIEFFGQFYKIIQFSTNFDIDLTLSLIKKYDGLCDTICISGLPQKIKFKGGFFLHPDAYRIKTAAKFSTIVDGQIVKDVYIPHALRFYYLKNPQFLSKRKIGFYSGALQKAYVEVLEDLENEIIMADPYFFMKMPFVLKGTKALDKFLKILSPILRKLKIKKSALPLFHQSKTFFNPALKEFLSCEILVAHEANINFLDLSHLKNKSLIIDTVSENLRKRLKAAGLKEALICLPLLVKYPHINYSILEGIIQIEKGIGMSVKEDDIISLVNKLSLTPELEIFSIDPEEVIKFSFIIHPLSRRQLFKHPYLRPFQKHSALLGKIVEEAISYSEGFFYGKITDIVSEKNGQRVEGLIYTITETPKKMLKTNPDIIYRKIIKLTETAYKSGAKIMGLGAYTKIVGDAGVTIERQSPIPVTTGNSLSAASTLWAAKLAVEKIGLTPTNENKFQGKVMVIGATGSIGAVSAKILSFSWGHLILVAPRPYKLMELKEEILKINPHITVEISTDADKHSGECNLIITTTSGAGKTILDIMKVRPGCVICDVSRPFDISEKEALKRPDVIVIASGEVQLPGKLDIKIDLGLEGNVVYACLAETALLAMERRFESFTLSRNINYQNVIEIDRMAHEHGVRLSQIMGHSGYITDQEFLLCKEHAINNLKIWKKNE